MTGKPHRQRSLSALFIFCVMIAFTLPCQANEKNEFENPNDSSFKEINKNKIHKNRNKSGTYSENENQNRCSVTQVSKHLAAELKRIRSKSRKCGRKRFKATQPMTINCQLLQAATLHAQDLSDTQRLSHQGSDGSTVGKRVKRAGFTWKIVGENVAQGHKTASEVANAWLDSPAHCKNIMNAKFDRVGVAQSGDYWVAVFAAGSKDK